MKDRKSAESTPRKRSLPKPDDLLWARDKVNDLLFSFRINDQLVSVGLTSKHIYEMDEQDMRRYTKLIEVLFTPQLK